MRLTGILGILFLVCVALTGCSRRQPITLTVKMPDGLSRGSARYQRLLERVVLLKIDYSTKGGERQSQSIPAGDWTRLPAADIHFPQGSDDELEVKVELWDRNLDGAPRGLPAAKGRGTLRAEEAEGSPNIMIGLSFAFGLQEYDY